MVLWYNGTMVLFSFVTRKNASTFSCVSQNLIVPLQAIFENLIRLLQTENMHLNTPQLGVIPAGISHLGRTITAPQHLSYVPLLRGCVMTVGDGQQ